MIVHTIFYVQDQKKSTEFYRSVLQIQPTLEVPGMTEFNLSETHILGIMPEKGIKKLLGETIPDPENAHGIPRAEIYFRVPNPPEYMIRAKELGAQLVSPLLPRDWGHTAVYLLDPDGHVIVFATESV